MAITLVNEKTNEITQLTENEKKTLSIIQYTQTEFSTFSQKPFTVVDSLVLAQLAYMNMTGVVPLLQEMAEPITIQQMYRAEYFDQFIKGIFMPSQQRKLIDCVCSSPRFRDIKVNYFAKSDDTEQEKQFAAVTFFLPDGNVYVAFRGTDDTLNGWKEDFNMFFMDTIPGQISALNYLRIIAAKTEGDIYIGGHSKGGNLALYAGSFAPADIQQRIITVFNHDGPGLSKGALAKEDYTDVAYKTNTTLPHESLIGLIFSSGDYNVVASRRVGLLQHDTFRWEIHNGDFIYEKEVKPGSNKLVDSLHQLMENLDVEEKELFVETVFELIYSAGATNLSEFPAMALAGREKIAETFKNLPPETADLLKTVVVDLVKIVASKTFALPEKEATRLAEAMGKITDTTDKIGQKVTETTEKITETKDKISGKITETGDYIGRKVTETTEKITETKDKISGKITETGDYIGRKVTETTDKINETKDRISDIITETTGKLNETKGKISGKISETTGKLSGLFAGKKDKEEKTEE